MAARKRTYRDDAYYLPAESNAERRARLIKEGRLVRKEEPESKPANTPVSNASFINISPRY